jgi:hypothetical protein
MSSISTLTSFKKPSQIPYTTRTAAIVGFCIRVDYKFIDNDGNVDTVNFHQELVAINVDLTTDFTLTNINVEVDSADNQVDISQLDYPVVEAYISLDDNSEVENPAAIAQGSPLQVCVKIDETVVAGNIIVEDILTFVISAQRILQDRAVLSEFGLDVSLQGVSRARSPWISRFKV